MTDPRTRARELLAAAQPGPWRAGTHETWHVYCPSTHADAMGPERVLLRMNEGFPYDHDAALIAAAPTLLADLCAEVERLREREADLSDMIREAAPLAWTAAADMNGAGEWEKQAVALLCGAPSANACLRARITSLENGIIAEARRTAALEDELRGEVARLREECQRVTIARCQAEAERDRARRALGGE